MSLGADLKEMKISRWAIALLFAALYSPAQQMDSYRTKGYLNGRYWNTLSDQQRIAYVMGYCEADRSHSKDGDVLECAGSTSREIKDGVSKIFEAPENGPISIQMIIGVYHLKATGTATDVIDIILRGGRIAAVKPEEPPKP